MTDLLEFLAPLAYIALAALGMAVQAFLYGPICLWIAAGVAALLIPFFFISLYNVTVLQPRVREMQARGELDFGSKEDS